MADKTNSDNLVPKIIPRVQDRSIVTEMETSYLNYSMSVIVARALPDVRDGLKPVHRRILYAMHEGGLRHNAKYRKSAAVVGDVMKSYHPHGDSAIYDSLVRMAQDFAMRYPLVDGQGNFGSMDGDAAAAMRYTESRMKPIASEMLADITKETVDFRDNYDGSEREPSVLPAKVPNLLLNGQIGIAVGMATSIPPHNLTELIDATIHIIEHEEVTVDDLMEYVKGPDFPTGGIVFGKNTLKQAYATGRGGVVVRAVAEVIEDQKGGDTIVVHEIPYGLNKASIVEKIADLVKAKKITGISDLRDESARGNVRIVVELKRDAYSKKILNQLYKLTPLQTKFHFNMLALVDGIQPRVLNLETILREFIKHRQVVVRRRTEYELKKAKARAHILEGLKLALDDIDAVIATIRASQTSDEAKVNLIKKFKLSVLQAEAILAMQLRTLAGLARKEIEDELAEKLKMIKEFERILADEKEVLKIVKTELEEMREKYGDKRRTKVVAREVGQFSDEELIPNERVVVTLTKGNYIKRTPVETYKSQGRGGKGKLGMITKEEDLIQHLALANTHDYLLFFTNLGRVFRIKGYEVPSAGRTAKGQAIVNLLQLGPEEIVTAMINIDQNEDKDCFLFMTTKKGVVKKTPLSAYDNVRATGIIAIKIDEGDELKWVNQTTGESEVIITTSAGQGLRFDESHVRAMGRSARGVRGIRLRENDVVVGADIVQDKAQLLVVSEKGFGKRTKVDNFTPHSRGGLGIKAAAVTAKTGPIITAVSVTEEMSDVLFVSKQGQIIRLSLNNIPVIGRATQGVTLMRMNKGDKVASVAVIAASKEEPEEGEEQVDDDTSSDKEKKSTPKGSAKR